MKTTIQRVHAREVFDSRGNPTVEVEVACVGARAGRAIVPSGASTGRFESVERRDRDPGRLDGAGVLQAVAAVRGEIADALVGSDASDQESIDRRLCELDGASNKSRLGANAALGVSLATACAAAEAQELAIDEHLRRVWERVPSGPAAGEQPAGASAPGVSGPMLPLPMVNMISGGLHAGGNLDFQDYLVIPVGAGSYRQALEWVVTIYRRLGQLLYQAGYEARLVGDEGGYGPRLGSNSEAVEFLLAAIEAAGLRPGEDVAIGLDVAAAHFYRDGDYHLAAGGECALTSDELIEMLVNWVESYPILSIEDALAEDDWDGWRRLTERLAGRVQLIGDDLFVTSRERLREGAARGAANSILIKLNQIGTLWETFETLRLALDSGYRPVISARSGETEDVLIADLAVATGAGQIKIGSITRSERLAKYNQLLRLEERLGKQAAWMGGAVFAGLAREGGR